MGRPKSKGNRNRIGSSGMLFVKHGRYATLHGLDMTRPRVYLIRCSDGSCAIKALFESIEIAFLRCIRMSMLRRRLK